MVRQRRAETAMEKIVLRYDPESIEDTLLDLVFCAVCEGRPAYLYGAI